MNEIVSGALFEYAPRIPFVGLREEFHTVLCLGRRSLSFDGLSTSLGSASAVTDEVGNLLGQTRYDLYSGDALFLAKT
ncbi:MAG TPA: hypothetical protein VNK49_14950 [Anaerolineales bacterium]|nr:hypothetical protein [Anaerolineales bacterium]